MLRPVSAAKRGLRPLSIAALAVAALAASGGIAGAAPTRQEVMQAEKLFNEARALMAKSKFETACPKLEQSQQLDPAPSTKYQLAFCFENTGRPATALAYYLEVAALAKAGGFKDKEKIARGKAEALEPKVPRIILEVDAKNQVNGLAILRDGAPVAEDLWNKPILVDPGEYSIEASAPGKKPFKTSVVVKGEGVKVTTPIVLADVEPFQTRDQEKAPAKGGSFGGQRVAALGVALVGIGGVVVGSVVGLDAKSTYDKAILDPKLCPTKKTCYPDGKRLVDEAKGGANIATVAFAAAGVALAGSVVLFLTAPSGGQAPASGQGGAAVSAILVPVVADGFGGAMVTGRF
jgi:tetratricopeptide (TPR) repeat protein